NGDAGRFWELNGTPDGRYGLWLRDVDANTDGVLMVNSAMNGDNIALSRAMPTGYWNIISHDNGSNANDDEANPVNFVYVPNGPGYVSGKFNGNEEALITNGSHTIRKTADGKYRLDIAGQTPATGTLLISAEGGIGNNVDNIISYQASADGLGWDIETRDLPQSPPTLQAMTTDPVASFVFLPFAPAVVQGPIHAANIKVVQNDAGNDPTSVTVTTALAIGDLLLRPGSNKGDYNVQIGNLATDDRNGGVLITSVSENGRDNQGSGIKYTTATVDPGTGAMFIALHEAIAGAGEFNTNVSAAYFSFAAGWQGGWLLNATNNGPITSVISNPPLTVSATAGANVVDSTATAGVYRLTLPGVNSQTDGVLLVNGAKNEDNYALAKAEADGSWTIYCIDNESNGGGGENDPVNFVFVPKSSTGYISGKFRGDGSMDAATTQAGSTASVVNSSTGTYRLTIPGESPRSGILIISPEGGSGANVDNIVNFQADGDGWIIESRDIAASGPTVLENIGASDFVASFIFIPTPEVGLDALGNVIVTDVEGDADNAITVVRNGANVRISDANALLTAGSGATQIDLHTIEIPLANITGQINLSTLGGNDTVTVDYSGGSLPSIQYDGGASATDGLTIKGSGTETAIYTPAAGEAAQGAIISSAGSVYFSNSEAVDISNLATATLQLPSANDTLTITNGTNLVGNSSTAALQVSGSSGATTFAPVAFWNSSDVVIDTVAGGSDGSDTISIASAAVGNNASLTINTGSGVDSVNINGAVALAGALNITTAEVNSTVAGTISTGTGLTIAQTGANSTLNGVISGATFTKTGVGALLLLASNTYTSNTFVNAGSLLVGNGGTTGSIAAASAITVAAPAKLVFFRNILNDNINNVISGAGQLSFVGTGVINQSGYSIGGNNSAFAGQIIIDKARVIVDNVNDVGTASSIDVLASGQIFASGNIAIARPLNLTGSGWLETAGNLGALRLAGGASWSGNVTLTGNARVTTYGSGDAGTISGVISGVISGPHQLAKTGAGSLALSANNSYSGGTLHGGGILSIAANGALGTGAFTFNGHNPLQAIVPDGASWTIGNNIVLPSAGAGGDNELLRIGDGNPTATTTLNLSGIVSGGVLGQTYTLLDSGQTGNHDNVLVLSNAANSFNGTIEIWRGTLAFTSDGALGNSSNTIRVNAGGYNGGLRVDAAGITLVAGRTLQLMGNETLNTQGFDIAIASTLTGSGRLRTTGASHVTFTTPNSWTNSGGLEIQSGHVTTVSQALTASRTVAIAAGSTLVSQGTLNFDNLTSAGSGRGGGTVVINGAGRLLLRNSASSVSTPDILYSANGVGSADYNAQIGVAVDLGTSPRYINVNTNQNDGIDYGGDLQFNGAISGSGGLIVNSAPSGSFNGSVGLHAANSFTGGLTIARGFVHLFAAGALNATTPNAVSLTPDAGNTAGLYLYGRDVTIGGLTNSGAGIAVIRNGAYSVGMPVWIVPAVATLTIEQATNAVFTGSFSDGPTDDANNAPGGGTFFALNIVKAGAGVLRLTKDSTHSGTTDVIAGTLLVDGTFQGNGEITVQTGATLGGTGSVTGNITAKSGGTVAPGGTPGTLTTAGGTTLQTGSIYRVELIGFTNDQLVTSGIDLTGAVLNASSNSNLGAGTPFVIINNTSASAVVGTFAGLAEGDSFFINGYQYFITYKYNGNDVA
ncbi:MAG TPA: autotransporter-associated beta strand repeat-containing protein, partial [Pirellulaceae bacterium]|nr:autotransporter-associated beta strand repeat-containing protein [Pirellulaceae bacterium]